MLGIITKTVPKVQGGGADVFFGKRCIGTVYQTRDTKEWVGSSPFNIRDSVQPGYARGELYCDRKAKAVEFVVDLFRLHALREAK